MSTRVIVSAIKSQKTDTIHIGNILKGITKTKSFWIALFLCPGVILLFYKQIDLMTSRATIALFAYQNGFFFESIFAINKIGHSFETS